MERPNLGQSSSEMPGMIPLNKLFRWVDKTFNSLNNGLDYWVTEKTNSFFSNPLIASFMNDVEIASDNYRATHQPSRLERWLDHGFDRLMSHDFMAELENQYLISLEKRCQRVNKWAIEHGKDPIF